MRRKNENTDKDHEEQCGLVFPLLPEEGIAPGEAAYGVIGDDDAACASIVLRSEGNTLSVEWLYVHPEYRRQGIAIHLLDEMGTLFAGKKDAIRLSWYDEIEGLSELLLKCGFYPGEGDPAFLLSLDGLNDCPEIRRMKGMRIKGMTEPLSALPRGERKKFSEFLTAEAGTDEFLNGCSKDYSFVLRENGKDINGCLLTAETEPAFFSVRLFFNNGQPQSSSRPWLRKRKKEMTRSAGTTRTIRIPISETIL